MTAPRVNEAAFQSQITDALNLYGWQWLHVRKSIGKRDGKDAWQTTTNIKGWPDLFCWHERTGRILAAELKGTGGVVKPEQPVILASLALTGVETHIWWPKDLDEALGQISANHPIIRRSGY